MRMVVEIQLILPTMNPAIEGIFLGITSGNQFSADYFYDCIEPRFS